MVQKTLQCDDFGDFQNLPLLDEDYELIGFWQDQPNGSWIIVRLLEPEYC